MNKKVDQAYLKEPTKLIGIGMALTDLSADKIPGLTMVLLDTALVATKDNLTFIIPLSNVKVMSIANEPVTESKPVKSK